MAKSDFRSPVSDLQPAPMSQRQTISYLKQRFAEVGMTLQSRHGQNFLIDLNLLRLLGETASVQPRDVVLEVGTGTGGLTPMIRRQAAPARTGEIDPGPDHPA